MKKWICILLVVSNILALNACTQETANEQERLFSPPSKTTIGLYTETELDVLDNVKESEVDWKSSDSSVLEISNGVIFAKSQGTANITATYKEQTQTLEFTVEPTSYTPFIDETEMSLILDSEFTFSPYLYVNGVARDDVEYKIQSENQEIVSVVDGDTLQANAIGTTSLFVSANWRGIADIATATIPCRVNANEGIVPNDKNIVLYNLDKSFRGQDFSNTAILQAEVYSDGEKVNDAPIVWESENEDVAVVSEGYVQARSVGETKIKGTYVKENDEVIETFVTISVNYACLDLNDDVLVGLNEMNNVIDASYYFAEGYTVNKIVVEELSGEYQVTDNMISGKSFTGVSAGEYSCRVYCAEEKVYCTATLVLADQVIYNSEDLFNAAQYLDSYIALANDIDNIGERTVNVTNTSSSGHPMIEKGGAFIGVFNGMGHTLSDFVINTANGGLFTEADGGAVFKNFAMKNATFSKTGQCSAPLFYRLKGTCFLENVFIEVNDFSESKKSGGVVAFLYMGGLNIKNSIFVVNGIDVDSANGAIAGRAFRGVFSMKNSYVISTGNLCSTITDTYNTTYEAVNAYSGFCYENEESFVSVRQNGIFDFSEFNKYWKLDKDIPDMSF